MHKSVKKIGIKIFVSVKATPWDPINPLWDPINRSQLTPWDPTNPAAQEEPIFVTTVRDTSTKDGFFGGLELRKKEMLAGAALTGKVISLKGPKKIKKADRPRGAKKSKDERNFKALVTVRTSGIRPCCALGTLPSR